MRRYGPYTVSATGVTPTIQLPGTPAALTTVRFINFSPYTLLVTMAGLQPVIPPECTGRVDLGGAFQWDGAIAVTTELDLVNVTSPSLSNALWLEGYAAGEAIPQVDPVSLIRTVAQNGAIVANQLVNTSNGAIVNVIDVAKPPSLGGACH